MCSVDRECRSARRPGPGQMHGALRAKQERISHASARVLGRCAARDGQPCAVLFGAAGEISVALRVRSVGLAGGGTANRGRARAGGPQEWVFLRRPPRPDDPASTQPQVRLRQRRGSAVDLRPLGRCVSGCALVLLVRDHCSVCRRGEAVRWLERQYPLRVPADAPEEADD